MKCDQLKCVDVEQQQTHRCNTNWKRVLSFQFNSMFLHVYLLTCLTHSGCRLHIAVQWKRQFFHHFELNACIVVDSSSNARVGFMCVCFFPFHFTGWQWIKERMEATRSEHKCILKMLLFFFPFYALHITDWLFSLVFCIFIVEKQS